jgi:hypothetical protein
MKLYILETSATGKITSHLVRLALFIINLYLVGTTFYVV